MNILGFNSNKNAATPPAPSPVNPAPQPVNPSSVSTPLAPVSSQVKPAQAAPTPPSVPVPEIFADDGDIQTVDDAMPGKYRVKVIRSKCISAASCVALAPKVFLLDEQNLAKVITQDELDDVKLLAAQSCPTMAIIVEDIQTGQQIWPPVQ